MCFRCGGHEVRERHVLGRAWGSRRRRDRDSRSVERADIAVSCFHQLRDAVLERIARTAKSESCEISLVHGPYDALYVVASNALHERPLSQSSSVAERSDHGDDQEDGSDQGHSPKGFGPQILLAG
jgi:hypothetical protein